jgi:hypothetical protein
MRVVGVGPEERVGHAHVRVDRTEDLVLDALEPRIAAIRPPAPLAAPHA